MNAARDQDLSSLIVKVDSHTKMLQAVQERQAEHSEKLATLKQELGSLRQMTEHGFAAIGSQLQVLIDRDQDPR